MGRNFLKLAAGITALACLPAAANAAVTYAFTAGTTINSGEDRTYTGGFTLTVNDYIATNRTFQASDLTSCTVTASDGVAASCAAQGLGFGSGNDIVSFGFLTADQGVYSFGYFFDKGAFGANGVYETTFLSDEHPGTLTVSGFGEPDVGGVPEPATWALMIGGFGLAGTALRRRRTQAAA